MQDADQSSKFFYEKAPSVVSVDLGMLTFFILAVMANPGSQTCFDPVGKVQGRKVCG
jgi:hypothetical protein